jgi:hypothetical protein
MYAKAVATSQNTLESRSRHKDLTPYVYDLNIFKRELEQEDGTYEYGGPWYVHIYEYDGMTTNETSDPIELTAEESTSLIDNDPYFQDHDPDLWYGLEGFMFDKWDAMSDRLKQIFEGLPKYEEEVLF